MITHSHGCKRTLSYEYSSRSELYCKHLQLLLTVESPRDPDRTPSLLAARFYRPYIRSTLPCLVTFTIVSRVLAPYGVFRKPEHHPPIVHALGYVSQVTAPLILDRVQVTPSSLNSDS